MNAMYAPVSRHSLLTEMNNERPWSAGSSSPRAPVMAPPLPRLPPPPSQTPPVRPNNAALTQQRPPPPPPRNPAPLSMPNLPRDMIERKDAFVAEIKGALAKQPAVRAKLAMKDHSHVFKKILVDELKVSGEIRNGIDTDDVIKYAFLQVFAEIHGRPILGQAIEDEKAASKEKKPHQQSADIQTDPYHPYGANGADVNKYITEKCIVPATVNDADLQQTLKATTTPAAPTPPAPVTAEMLISNREAQVVSAAADAALDSIPVPAAAVAVPEAVVENTMEETVVVEEQGVVQQQQQPKEPVARPPQEEPLVTSASVPLAISTSESTAIVASPAPEAVVAPAPAPAPAPEPAPSAATHPPQAVQAAAPNSPAPSEDDEANTKTNNDAAVSADVEMQQSGEQQPKQQQQHGDDDDDDPAVESEDVGSHSDDDEDEEDESSSSSSSSSSVQSGGGDDDDAPAAEQYPRPSDTKSHSAASVNGDGGGDDEDEKPAPPPPQYKSNGGGSASSSAKKKKRRSRRKKFIVDDEIGSDDDIDSDADRENYMIALQESMAYVARQIDAKVHKELAAIRNPEERMKRNRELDAQREKIRSKEQSVSIEEAARNDPYHVAELVQLLASAAKHNVRISDEVRRVFEWAMDEAKKAGAREPTPTTAAATASAPKRNDKSDTIITIESSDDDDDDDDKPASHSATAAAASSSKRQIPTSARRDSIRQRALEKTTKELEHQAAHDSEDEDDDFQGSESVDDEEEEDDAEEEEEGSGSGSGDEEEEDDDDAPTKPAAPTTGKNKPPPPTPLKTIASKAIRKGPAKPTATAASSSVSNKTALAAQVVIPNLKQVAEDAERDHAARSKKPKSAAAAAAHEAKQASINITPPIAATAARPTAAPTEVPAVLQDLVTSGVCVLADLLLGDKGKGIYRRNAPEDETARDAFVTYVFYRAGDEARSNLLYRLAQAYYVRMLKGSNQAATEVLATLVTKNVPRPRVIPLDEQVFRSLVVNGGGGAKLCPFTHTDLTENPSEACLLFVHGTEGPVLCTQAMAALFDDFHLAMNLELRVREACKIDQVIALGGSVNQTAQDYIRQGAQQIAAQWIEALKVFTDIQAQQTTGATKVDEDDDDDDKPAVATAAATTTASLKPNKKRSKPAAAATSATATKKQKK